MSAECSHGKAPHDRRAVTTCFGATREGPQTMIEQCDLCGATRVYDVIDRDGLTLEYWPWQRPVAA
jgi:hypothetical protein